VLYTFDPKTPKSAMPAYDIFRDMRDTSTGADNIKTESQMLYHIFLGGSMTEEADYWFPKGIAIPLEANAGIDFNAHYVNGTSSTIPGECYANIYTLDSSQVQHIAKPIFSLSTDFTLPPHQETVVTDNVFTDTASTPMNVFMLTSHYHARGKQFQIQIVGGKRNGEIVYTNSEWSHPLVKTFDPPIILNKGEGLRAIVTYYNNTPNTIQFGFKSTDEMNVIFGHYY
jgi:hypothetical protein